MAALPHVIVIVGPTAVGKTTLSIRLAKKLKGEVVSGDSRQVYRGLNLGTGKVTKREMQGVPHHLLDVANAKTVYAASDFVRDGHAAIAEILSRGKLPVIVGGTGFYIDALLGRRVLAEVPPNPKLRKQLATYSLQRLQTTLKNLDPKRFKTIDQKNPHRLIRAIEIAKYPKPKTPTAYPRYRATWIGVTLPFAKLQQNIEKRLYKRMKQGMLREAQRLHRQGLSWKRMEALGLEYRAMARHLQGKITKAEMLGEIEQESLRYAKRQMTWFRANKDITWVGPKGSLEKVLRLVRRN